MGTFLLTWNPANSVWDDFDSSLKNCREFGSASSYWSCRNSHVQPGDRVFMLRLGKNQKKGIIASGRAIGIPYRSADWKNRADTSRYIKISYDVILDAQKALKLDELEKHFPNFHWTPEQSGILIHDDVTIGLENLWTTYLQGIGLSSNEEKNLSVYLEGDRKSVIQNRYERNDEAREACVQQKGYKCLVCNYDFFERWGEIGRNYIHVHHAKLLCKAKKNREVKPETDLFPLCPNCHAMAHRRLPPYSIEELKEMHRPRLQI